MLKLNKSNVYNTITMGLLLMSPYIGSEILILINASPRPYLGLYLLAGIYVIVLVCSLVNTSRNIISTSSEYSHRVNKDGIIRLIIYLGVYTFFAGMLVDMRPYVGMEMVITTYTIISVWVISTFVVVTYT